MPSARSTPDPAALQNPYCHEPVGTGPPTPWASGLVAAAVVAGVTGLVGSAHADPDEPGTSDVLAGQGGQLGFNGSPDLDLSPGDDVFPGGGTDGPDDLFTAPDTDLSFGTVELEIPDSSSDDVGSPAHDDVTAVPIPDRQVGGGRPPSADVDQSAIGTGPVPGSGGRPVSEQGDRTDVTVGDVRTQTTATTGGLVRQDDANTLGMADDHHRDTDGRQELVGAASAMTAEQTQRPATGLSEQGGSDGRSAAADPDVRAGGGDGRDGPPPRTTTAAAPDPGDHEGDRSEVDDQDGVALAARPEPLTTAEQRAAVNATGTGAPRSRDLVAERAQLETLVGRLGDILPAGAESTGELIISAAGTPLTVDPVADGADPRLSPDVDHGNILNGTGGQVRRLAAALGDPAAVPEACTILVDLQCRAGDRPLQNGEDVTRRITEETRPLLESGRNEEAARLAVRLMGEDFFDRGTAAGNLVTPDDVLASLLGAARPRPAATATASAGTTTRDPVRAGTLTQLRSEGFFVLPAATTADLFDEAVDGLLRGATDMELAEPQARITELADAAERGDVFGICSAYIGVVAACNGLPRGRADDAVAAVEALRQRAPARTDPRTLTPDEVRAYEVAHDAVFRGGAMSSVSGDLVSPRLLSFLLDPLSRTDGIPRTGSVDRPAGERPPRTARPDFTAGPSGAGRGGVEDDGDTASRNWIEQSGLPPNAFSGNVVNPRTGQVYAGGDTGFRLVEPDYDREVLAAHYRFRTSPSRLTPPDPDEQRRWAELLAAGGFTVLDPHFSAWQRSMDAARGDLLGPSRRMWNELPLFTTEIPGNATLDLLGAQTDLEDLLERVRMAREAGTGDVEDAEVEDPGSLTSNEVARQALLTGLQGRMQDAQPLHTITMAACQIELLACTGEITREAADAARARIDEAVSVYDRGMELARTLVPDSRLGSRHPAVNDLIGTVSRIFGDNSAADAAATRVLPEVHPYRRGASTYGMAPLPGILPDELTHLQIHPPEYRALLQDVISPRELANLEGAVQSYMGSAQAIGYDSGGSGGPNVLPNADERARRLVLLEESLARYRTVSRAEGFDSPAALTAFDEAAELAAELRTAMLGDAPVDVTPRTFEPDDPVPGDLWNQAEMEALVALWQASGDERSLETFVLDTLGSSRIDNGNVPWQFSSSTHRPPSGVEDLEGLEVLEGLEDFLDLEDFEGLDDIRGFEAGGSAVASRVPGTMAPGSQGRLRAPTVPWTGADEQGAEHREEGGQVPSEPERGTRSSGGGVTVGGGLGRPVSLEEAARAIVPGGDPKRVDPPTAVEESLIPRPGERTEFDPNAINRPGEPPVVPELTGIPRRDPDLDSALYPNGPAGPRWTFPAGREQVGDTAGTLPGAAPETPSPAVTSSPAPTGDAKRAGGPGWVPAWVPQQVRDAFSAPVAMTHSPEDGTYRAMWGVPFTGSSSVGVYGADGGLISREKGDPPTEVDTGRFMDPVEGAAVGVAAAFPLMAAKVLSAAGPGAAGSMVGAGSMAALLPLPPALPGRGPDARGLVDGLRHAGQQAWESVNGSGRTSAPAAGSAGAAASRVGGDPRRSAMRTAGGGRVDVPAAAATVRSSPDRGAAARPNPQPVVEQAQRAGEAVVQQAQRAAQPVVQQAQRAAQPVVQQAQRAAQPVVQQAQRAAQPVVQQAQRAQRAAQPVVQQAQRAAAELDQNVLRPAAQAVRGVAAQAGTTVGSALKRLTGGGR